MKTANYNVVLNQGSDFDLSILISGDSGPIDITGYTFSSDIKISTDPTVQPVASFTFTLQNQMTNTGQVSWTLPNATTKMLLTSIINATVDGLRTVTPYLFDVLMTDNGGEITRIIQGLILVSPGVTGQTVMSP
jgi:hypothetical protein